MTLPFATIEDSIRQAMILAGSNTRVIFFRPNAPRPKLPYTSIQFLTITGEGSSGDIPVFNHETNIVEYYGCREIFYTINCYGDNAFDEANKIKGAFNKITVRDKLKELAGISVWRMDPVRDLSTLLDSSYESRASFDIVFNVLLEDGSTTEDLGYFTTVRPSNWSNANDL
jgi:hypothetical protein